MCVTCVTVCVTVCDGVCAAMMLQCVPVSDSRVHVRS